MRSLFEALMTYCVVWTQHFFHRLIALVSGYLKPGSLEFKNEMHKTVL